MVKEEIESGIGFNLRGGLNILFNDKSGLVFDIRYLVYNPKAASTVTQADPFQKFTAENDVKLNNISFTIGLEVHF